MVASRLGFINKSNHTYENLYNENVYLQFNSQDKQQDADHIKKNHCEMKGLRLASFVIKIFCYTLQIQLWTLYYSELKMTEELSKHVLKVSFIFLKFVTYLLLSRPLDN